MFFQIVAIDVLENEVASELFFMHLCTGEAKTIDYIRPKSPLDEWMNVTVKEPVFFWEKLEQSTLAIKCDVSSLVSSFFFFSLVML